jgi:Tfp pilus assembly protein PilN
MKQGVNLISQEAKKTLRLLKLRKSFKTAIFGAVGLFVVFALLVVLIFVWVSQSLKSNQQKISTLKGEIKALEKNETYAVIIANRVKGISSVLKERKSYLEVMEEVGNLSVPGFVLQGLEIDGRGNFKLSGICNSRESLAAFNEKVEEIESKKKYREVVYPAVTRSVGGSYGISLVFKQ